MNDPSNIEIVRQMYNEFGKGNIQEVLTWFHKDIVWERPGGPSIPFAGSFKGTEGLMSMFTIIGKTIKIKSFIPQKFFGNEDTVIVTGQDSAQVIKTGKEYASDWAHVFTFHNKKVIHVRVLMDTLSIAKAFQS